MNSMIGIQIPPELHSEVESFCRVRKYTATELYISLIDPELLGQTPMIREKLEAFCLDQVDFSAVVSSPARYRHELLYLQVQSGPINLMRDRLARHFQLSSVQDYRPHLVIMRQSPEQHIEICRYHDEACQMLTKSFRFDVGELTVYTREADDGPFAPAYSVPFTGRR